MCDDLVLADRGMNALLAGMGGVALLAAFIIWAPWNGTRVRSQIR